MPTRRRAYLLISLIAALAAASLIAALAAGSMTVGTGDVVRALLGEAGGVATDIVRDLRLPRALTAFACGGLLALAGAMMQVLLRNALADPYVLGVSGGAAVGALATMLAGAVGWLVSAGAFAGALASTSLVFALARGTGPWSPMRMLLTGVVIAAGWGAVVALILSVAPEAQLRGMLFWLIGDLSAPLFAGSTLAILALALAVALAFARDLNALARGETVA